MARKNSIRMHPEEMRASMALAWVYALRMRGMFLVLPVLALTYPNSAAPWCQKNSLSVSCQHPMACFRKISLNKERI